MSEASDSERAEMALEFRIERSKRIRRQMDELARFYLEGLSVTLIAQRLCTTRRRVYWLMRALQLIDDPPGKWQTGDRPNHLYGLGVPAIDDEASQ